MRRTVSISPAVMSTPPLRLPGTREQTDRDGLTESNEVTAPVPVRVGGAVLQNIV